MKDFKTLQAGHEALLAMQVRLGDLTGNPKVDAEILQNLQRTYQKLSDEAQKAAAEQEAAEGKTGQTPEALDEVSRIKALAKKARAEYEKYRTSDQYQAGLTEAQRKVDELVAAASQYIQDAKESSAKIGSPREREQLRANLRYWGSFVYEKTGSYPNTDLAPAPSVFSSALIIWPVIIIGIVGLTLLGLAARGIFVNAPRPTETRAALVTGTPGLGTPPVVVTSAGQSKTPRIPSPTPLSPSPTFTLLPPTLTLTPTQALSASLTPPPDTGVLVTLTTPGDGQAVTPNATFTGTYTNLQPGWAIHVLLQPKTRPGLSYYPIPAYFTVPAGAPNGAWTLPGQFGSGLDLLKAEQYNIKLAVTTDGPSLAAVNGAVTTGLAALPGGVIPFSKVTNVSRAAYQPVNGPRLLYTAIDRVTGASTIVTANLDGSDARPLAHTPDVAESFPALSPDGTRIAFVAVRRDAKNNTFYSIGLMDSNGENQRFFFERSGWVYEQPAWSPDGSFLAFSATDRTPYPGGGSTWMVYLADARAMLAGGAALAAPRALTTGESAALGKLSNRYPEWLDNATVLYSQRTLNSQLVEQVNINTLDTRVFFDPHGSAAQIALSPDHKSAVFIMADDTGPQVFLAFLDPGRADKKSFALTTGATPKQFPAWDPAGQVIYFELDQTAASSLWAVNSDGSNLRQIPTNARTSEIQPSVGVMNAYFKING